MSKAARFKGKLGFFLVGILLILYSAAIPGSLAETSPVFEIGPAGPAPVFPREYGDIIYRANEGSPNHLYIIGMSHRDAITRENGKNTTRAQAELYKIGEWLVETQGVQIILPEGFFKSPGPEKPRAIKVSLQTHSLGLKDIQVLLESGNYFNAELLLREHYPVFFEQVEDRDIYDAVNEGIYRVVGCEGDPIQYAFSKAELDYLQEKRTAAMLQKIPGAVGSHYDSGGIRTKRAILTIGLSHINGILRYLGENRINIDAPLFAPEGYSDITDELLLAKENYGITVIIPRSLMEDRQALTLTGLADISPQK